MNFEINVHDFLTEEHVQQIQSKLSEAIEQIDSTVIAKSLQKEIIEQSENITDNMLDGIDLESMSKVLTTMFKNALKQKI